jgi:hypothetical protein|tara:strand:+ start:919 stop:1140 length:222 start_codon:yes stop_codon:yes gene_type:complete
MANDHAQDRYDPPKVGSDFDKEYFGDVNIGEVFRLRPDSKAKSFRKVKDGVAFDITESREIQLGNRDEIYVKS